MDVLKKTGNKKLVENGLLLTLYLYDLILDDPNEYNNIGYNIQDLLRLNAQQEESNYSILKEIYQNILKNEFLPN